MEQQTVNMLSTYMPNIGHYRTQFSSLNSLLGKTTLTGKISSLDIAENLFEFMEATQQKFNNLQDRLIDTLIEQNFYNRYKEASVSAAIIANLLVHTIDGCSLDAIALAKGSRLVRFFSDGDLKNEEKIQILKKHLQHYQNIYTIYKNIILVNTQGEIILSLEKDISGTTKNSHILEAIKNNEKIEALSPLDFYGGKRELISIVPIMNESLHQCAGALITIFDFYQEIDQICQYFTYHLPQTILLVVDGKNNIIYSDNEHRFPIGENVHFTTKENCNFIEVGKRQAFAACCESVKNIKSGSKSIAVDWKFYRIVPLQVAFNPRGAENDFKIPEDFLNNSSLRTENLDAVILEAENINEDLGDVVINGEIIASKSRSYALNPILDSIRLLSDQINFLCIQSIENLQRSIFNSLFSIIDGYARSSIQLLDRYFYEKSNNCRWISHSSIFRKYLSAHMNSQLESSDTRRIIAKLEDINKTYTSYADIVLFNTNGAVLANSHLIKGTHHTVSSESIVALKGMANSNRYYLSNFEVPQFSGSTDASYTFMAPICDELGHFIGGVAFVIKVEEFKEILVSFLQKESFLLGENNEIFTFFIDQDKNIIATTKDDVNLDSFKLENKFDPRNPKSQKQIMTLDNGATYLVSIEPSVGYREFKAGSTHRHFISCFICIKIRDEDL